MKLSAEAAANPTHFPDYSHDHTTQESLSRSQISSFSNLTDLPHSTLISPNHTVLTSQYYPSSFTLNHQQNGTGSSSYPESSQRTYARGTGNPYPPFFDVAANDQFDTARSAERRSAHYKPDLNLMHPTISSSTHQPQNMPLERAPYHGDPSDTSVSSDERERQAFNKMVSPPGPPLFSYYNDKDPPQRHPSPALLLERNPLPVATSFQGRYASPAQSDPGGDADRMSYANLEQHRMQSHAAPQSPFQFSIPMRNDAGWSSASSRGAYDHAQPPVSSTSNVALDSGSPASLGLPELVDHVHADTAASSTSGPSASNAPSKKKKSKMHDCEVCGKKFPRPSGLKTHMNTHNNLKPFSCGFVGCPRTFTVRSNAKRHLRTHGVDTLGTHESAEAPYVVGFSTPTIMQPAAATHELAKLPYKIRWMPPSLSACKNAHGLMSLSDDDSESEDGQDEVGRSGVSIPFPPVVPSSSGLDSHAPLEERNSYLDAPPYPYHPSQFRVLPGPAVANSQPVSAA